MTTEEITGFCDNLKASLLAAHARGEDISLSSKVDSDPVTSGGAISAIIDHVYMGQTLKIKVGRPATRQRQKDEAKHAAMMESLLR